ncbi:MAG: hypothetical protein ACR2OJ_08175 [Hyphomicrobiales bacterium]
MREIFLGKPWHWAMLVVIIGLLWMAGVNKLHVIEFNSFIVALFLGTTAVILLILRTTKPGEQITRDELIEEDDNEPKET